MNSTPITLAETVQLQVKEVSIVTAAKTNMRPILLCAGPQGRAVLYGRVEREPEAGDTVRLYDARMIIYWAGPHGLLGIAVKGPAAHSRLSPTVPLVVETCWLSYIRVTPEAAKIIEEWPNLPDDAPDSD